MRSGKPLQGGLAYLLLLIVLSLLALGSTVSVSMGAMETRRAAEEELLAVGAEYERALASYRASSRGGPLGANPKSLQDLLLDPRYPGVRRHLRKAFADPLTGHPWGVVFANDGSIEGFFSTASGVPIRQAGFAGVWETFNEAQTYRQWVFGLPPEKRKPVRRVDKMEMIRMFDY